MLPMEHPSLFAVHQLQFFCCASGAGHKHSWCLHQHQSHIFWLPRAHSVTYRTFSTADTSEHSTHLNFGPRRPSLQLHCHLHTNLTRNWLSQKLNSEYSDLPPHLSEPAQPAAPAAPLQVSPWLLCADPFQPVLRPTAVTPVAAQLLRP